MCLHLGSKHPKSAMDPIGTDFLLGLGCSQEGHSAKSLHSRANKIDSVLHVCSRNGSTPLSPSGPSAVSLIHTQEEKARKFEYANDPTALSSVRFIKEVVGGDQRGQRDCLQIYQLSRFVGPLG